MCEREQTDLRKQGGQKEGGKRRNISGPIGKNTQTKKNFKFSNTMVSNSKVLFVAVVLGLIAVSHCQKDEKKEEVVAATLATPTALFKCGEVRIHFFFDVNEKLHDGQTKAIL